MKKSLIHAGGVLATVVLMGAGAASANAVGFQATNGIAGGHAVTQTTNQVFTIDASHNVTCTAVTVTGGITVAVAPSTTNPAGGVPAFSGCTLNAAGPHPAVVSSPNAWLFTATSLTAGTVDTGGTVTVTYGSCVLSVPRVTGKPVTLANSGVNGSITGAVTGLPYTSTGCAAFGIAASGSTATYNGSISVANVNVVP